MKQRIIALLLALALALSLGMMTALADGMAIRSEEELEALAEEERRQAEQAANAETELPAAAKTEETAPAGPDPAPAVDPETGKALAESVEIVPDAVGTVSFANLERRIRENNLQLLALEQNVALLETMDYEDMAEELRDAISNLGKAKQFTRLFGDGGDSYAYEQLQQATTSLRDQLDDLKEGKLQKDNAVLQRQLENLQDQIVMGGETLYTALAAMETQEAAIQRQLAAMNRMVEEMELRYQLGQISALQLEQTKAGRSSLVSGLETLQMNIGNYKLQLETLMGAEQTGTIRLGDVPAVTEEQLSALNMEKDLAAAKSKSYELLAAQKELEDAKENYDDVGVDTGYRESKVQFRQAKSNWQAAQYTYNAAIQDYELRFGTLNAQVQDYPQILNAARVSLAAQQAEYASMELKHRQGTLSQNDLLDAEDALRAAEETVKSASNDQYSAYNSYCWAVQHGILN